MNFQCTPGTKGSSDVALLTQPVTTCLKLTIETLEQGVKYP